MGKCTVAMDARLVMGTSSGDSTYWTSLVEALATEAVDIDFLLISTGPKPTGVNLAANFSWREVKARSSRLWSLFAFPLAAKRLGANAIHAQYSLSPLVGSRGITTIHDVSFLIGPEWFKPRDRILLSRTVPAAAKRARKVLTVSETSKREVESYIPSAKGKTVATPLACPSWIQRVDRNQAREKVEAELGISDPFLLTVSTRWPRKNMELAVNAASLLDSRFSQRLVLTGKSGWGDLSVGTRGVASGYVDTEMLSCLYSAADLYLAPSRHEGFGIPVLEAFRCGCPVICSSGGALPEVVGDSADVMTSWDPSDWANRINGLLGDPSKLDSLRDLGLRREPTFSWAETARRTAEVYREVAG